MNPSVLIGGGIPQGTAELGEGWKISQKAGGGEPKVTNQGWGLDRLAHYDIFNDWQKRRGQPIPP